MIRGTSIYFTFGVFLLTPSVVDGILLFRNHTSRKNRYSNLFQWPPDSRALVATSLSTFPLSYFDGVNAADAAVGEPDARWQLLSAEGIYAHYGAFSVVVSILAFYPLGKSVVVEVVIYILTLTLMRLSMGNVFSYGFSYPKFVVSLHMLFSCVAAFVVMLYRKFKHNLPIVVPTMGELFLGILPISLTSGLSIAMEHSELTFVPSALSQVVASTAPMMCALLTWAFGMFPVQLFFPVAVVVIGCVISIQGEVDLSLIWFLLLLGSVLLHGLGGLRDVLQQRLMTGAQRHHLEPVALVAWTSLFSCVKLIVCASYSEGTAPIHNLTTSRPPGLNAAIAVSCALAVTLNFSSIFLVRRLGAVGMQMVGQTNGVSSAIVGAMALSESFTVEQRMGIFLALVGVHWYSKIKCSVDQTGKPVEETLCRL